jgi:hypothetical protein
MDSNSPEADLRKLQIEAAMQRTTWETGISMAPVIPILGSNPVLS